MLTIGLAGLIYGLFIFGSPYRQFGRAYHQLRLGMTQDEVRNLFGAPPDFDCSFKSSQIWYYRRPDIFSEDTSQISLQRGATVTSLNQLPDPYAHVQLAFDANGRLHAYTIIGETSKVQSVNGPVKGSNVNKLPPSDF